MRIIAVLKLDGTTLISSVLFAVSLLPNTNIAIAQTSVLPQCPSERDAVRNNCQGLLRIPTRYTYVGEWKNNQFDGRGTLTFPDGSKYVGEFTNGLKNGHGTLTLPNGAEYVGEWRDNLRNGQGTLTEASGIKYIGEYKDDKPNGQGTLTYPSGAKYVGEFKDGHRNGQGTYTFGSGKYSGDKYIGEFKDDDFNGQGSYVWAADGSQKLGIWKNGKLVNSVPGISIVIERGTFIVPVTINSKMTLNFTIDTGASDVAIPADVVSTLMRTGSIAKEDFLGQANYQLADGSIAPSPVFIIRSLTVGDKIVQNVRANVTSAKGDLLLGQSFLGRFRSWSVDNKNRLLFLN
jgi:clan AA aspartic protease (TIGR02281 family)